MYGSVCQYLAAVFLLVGAASSRAYEAFTIVALPDTQNYVDSATNAPLFTQQTQWIADEFSGANTRNIQFVTHLGDLVSTGSDLTQWGRADASLSVLDSAGIPYGVLPGNHDLNDTGNKNTGTVNYVNHFGPTRFAGDAWYGGADPSGNNSYQTFRAGGYEFIHLSLEWRPADNRPQRTPSPIAWAQSVLDANPGTPVILSTHEYIDDNPAGRGAAGDALWEQLIDSNDQIFLVLNGHNHGAGGLNDGEYHQVSTNAGGNAVYEVLQNYQDYPNGGDGWLRLIEFDVPNNQISFETYSPVLGQFQTETTAQVGPFASQFSFDVDFVDRLGPATIPPSPPKPAREITFQQGVDEYTGTSDTKLQQIDPDSTFADLESIEIDSSSAKHGLIRFGQIIGDQPRQVPDDGSAVIRSATLVIHVFESGDPATVHEMLIAWEDDTATWNALGDGVQADDVEASSETIGIVSGATGDIEIDVTSSLQRWLDDPSGNYGWALLPTGDNGFDFYSAEGEFAPELRVSFDVVMDADLDGDGDVNDADFGLFFAAFSGPGVPSSNPSADLDSDSDVDDADFGLAFAAFTGAGSSAANVPEPTSAVLLTIGGAVLARRRRRVALS